MELTIKSSESKASKKIEVAGNVFAEEFNPTLVHQAVTTFLAGGRQGSKAQKTRAEVRGGGAKPWRQKGMGKARAGTRSSPIWVGGGRTFAAKPRDFSKKINKKMYSKALCCILSRLVRDERLIVVEDFSLSSPKTKEFILKLKELDLSNALIIVSEVQEELYFSSRNVPRVNLIDVTSIDPVILLKHDKVVVTVDVVRQLEERFS